MAMILGTGHLQYEPVIDWEKLPEGWSFIDVRWRSGRFARQCVCVEPQRPSGHRFRPRRQFLAILGRRYFQRSYPRHLCWAGRQRLLCRRWPAHGSQVHYRGQTATYPGNRKPARTPSGPAHPSTARRTLPSRQSQAIFTSPTDTATPVYISFPPTVGPFILGANPALTPGSLSARTTWPSTRRTWFTLLTAKTIAFRYSTPRATTSPCGTISTGRTAFALTVKATCTLAN